MTSGMPVSWPVPTAAQQRQYTNEATKKVIEQVTGRPAAPAGPAMHPSQLAQLQRVIGGLLEASRADGNQRKYEDIKGKMDDLFQRCLNGGLGESTQAKLVTLCGSLDAGDAATVNRIRVDLASNDWEASKNWLTALKMILPR